MSATFQARPNPSRRRVRNTLLFIGALLFLFEEWLWTGFLRLFKWLGRFGLLRWLDARLARVAPMTALIILCVPMVFLFPVKIAGLWMIASGRFFTGCALMLAAKITSTAIIARVFLTCRPQLLQMAWFARVHALICAFRDRIHCWMEKQAAWTDAKRFVRRMRILVGLGARERRSDGTYAPRRGALWRWRSRRRAAVAASMERSASVERERH